MFPRKCGRRIGGVPRIGVGGWTGGGGGGEGVQDGDLPCSGCSSDEVGAHAEARSGGDCGTHVATACQILRVDRCGGEENSASQPILPGSDWLLNIQILKLPSNTQRHYCIIQKIQ